MTTDPVGLDFPTAWKIQRETTLDHDPECSSNPEHPSGMGGPHWLCDCGAVRREWERLADSGKP